MNGRIAVQSFATGGEPLERMSAPDTFPNRELETNVEEDDALAPVESNIEEVDALTSRCSE